MHSRHKAERGHVRTRQLSRRAVISGGSAVPLLTDDRAFTETDAAIGTCTRWLAVDAEQHRLQLEWGSLEGQLMKAHGWHRLSPEQQAAIPEGARLVAIDARLDVLEVEGEALLRAMSPAPATSVAAVVANLSVAARLIFAEDHPRAHGLITRAIRDLGALSGGT